MRSFSRPTKGVMLSRLAASNRLTKSFLRTTNQVCDVGYGGDLEMFFWQCSASGVTMAPRATPSSASSVCAAGISLDVSAMSMWASTSAVSVANALSTWAGRAVVEPVKAAAQRLAIQRDAALSRCGARRLQQGGMTAEGRLHPGRIEPLEDVADGGV